MPHSHPPIENAALSAPVRSAAAVTVDMTRAREDLPHGAFRTVLGQAALGLSWTAAALALGFAIRILLARRMPVVELGIVFAAQGIFGLVLAAAALGMPEAVTRFVGMEATSDSAPRRTVLGAIRIAAASTSITAVAMLLGLWAWFGSAMTPSAVGTTVVLISALPLFAIGDVLGAAYWGINRLSTKLATLDAGRPALVAVALVISPLALTSYAPYVAGLYASAGLITAAALWVRFARDRRWQSRGAGGSRLLRFGLPLAGGAVVAGPLVNGILPGMLSVWAGTAPVALYGIALSLGVVVALPLTLVEQAILPTWSRYAARGADGDLAQSYRDYSGLCFACVAGAGVLLMAHDEMMLALLFGSPYEAARGPLRWAVGAILLGASTGPNEGMLRAVGLTAAIFHTRVVSAVSGIVTGAILIPTQGLLGAVLAYVVTTVTINAGYAIALYLKTGMHPFGRSQAMTAGMAALGVIAATATTDFPIGGRVAATGIAALVVLAHPKCRLAFRQLITR